MNCFLHNANLVYFVADNQSYTIDDTSPLGWYILFNNKLAQPQLVLRRNINQYLEYSTDPLNESCDGVYNNTFGLGKCSLVFCNVEDSQNAIEKKEKNEGIASENANYSGNVIQPRDQPLDNISNQAYGFVKRFGFFDIYSLDVDLDISHSKFVELEYRIIPSDRIVPNFVFGTPIYINTTEIKYNPVEEFIATTTGTNISFIYIGDLITNIILTNTSPFEVVLENRGILDISYNIFVDLIPDVGTVRIFKDKVYVNSGTNTTVNISVQNGKNYYFKPEIVI